MSNNMQKIIEYAKDPSCVMCVTPHFGGAWHSSIRDGDGPQPVLPTVAGDSIAQRLGLLTKYNCDTSNMDFRLASTSANNWYVKTGLNFAGWSRPLTIIGRMYIAPDSGGSSSFDYDTNVYHPLIQQGWMQGGLYVNFVIGILYINQNGVNQYRVALSLQDKFVLLNAQPQSPPHGRFVTISVTIDPATGMWEIYENGVLLNSAISTNLIGFRLLTDVSGANNTPVTYMHQLNPSWQNRNDIIDYVAVFDKVLNSAEIKYLSYDSDDWIDLSLPVDAGTINIVTEAIPELEWTLPDGTKSTASTLNQTVEAGTLRMKCYKYGKTFQIYTSPAIVNTPILVADLPRVTNRLDLYGLAGLIGTAADLPRVTHTLYLANLAGLTGTVADLPRVTSYLALSNLAGLTGTAADLPSNTAPIRQIFYLAGITGALPVVSTNTNVYYYGNSQVTPAEYDQTIQNIVDAGGVNGTLRISNTRTSASDANIATLQSRGWTVSEH